MPAGWVQLPFYASRNTAPDVMPEWEIVDFAAESRALGASGVLAIPIPPDADRIRKLRVAGRIERGRVTFNLTRTRLGADHRQLAQGSVQKDQPDDFDVRETVTTAGKITNDDTLSLTIYADEGAGHHTRVHFVAVQFQRSY